MSAVTQNNVYKATDLIAASDLARAHAIKAVEQAEAEYRKEELRALKRISEQLDRLTPEYLKQIARREATDNHSSGLNVDKRCKGAERTSWEIALFTLDWDFKSADDAPENLHLVEAWLGVNGFEGFGVKVKITNIGGLKCPGSRTFYLTWSRPASKPFSNGTAC